MPLTTRREFAKSAMLLPLAFTQGVAREITVQEIGSMPRGVNRIPTTPFDGPEGSWTLAVMPDSQHDAAFFPEVMLRQTEWIAAHRESHRIAMLVHEGDITDDNGPRQWDRARQAFDMLGRAGVAYSLTTGNHDLEMIDHKLVSRSTRLNEYFPPASYTHSPRWGLLERERMENSWHEFDAPSTGRVLVLSLELGPPDTVLEWARAMIAARKPDLTVLVTHAYLYHDGSRYDYASKGESQSAAPKGYPYNLWLKEPEQQFVVDLRK
jgi:hypothetical protein